MSTSTKRGLKVSQSLLRNLATLLRQYSREPLLNTVIISHVNVSNDLSSANIFFSVLDKNTLPLVKEAFERETKRIRGLLGKKIKLRYIPELKFMYDDFAEKKEKLLALIDRLSSDHDIHNE